MDALRSQPIKTSETCRLFTPEERIKLKTALGVNTNQEVDAVVDSIHHLLTQSIFHAIKPKLLTQELTDLGFDTDKVVAFVDLWTNNGSQLIETFKEKSFEMSAIRLTNSSSALKLRAHQRSDQEFNAIPVAQIDFTLTSDNRSTNLSLDLERNDLWHFYESLEEIQSQVDALYK